MENNSRELEQSIPLITICLPSHNGLNYIQEAIESILAQTYTNWQLFIVASTTDVEELARKYAESDKRISFKLCIDSPLVDKLNMSFCMGEGKYVTFLAHDDRWFPTFLEETVDYLESHKDVDFVYTNYIDSNEMDKENIRQTVNDTVRAGEYQKGKMLKSHYMGVFWIWKRELWEKVPFECHTKIGSVGFFDWWYCFFVERAGAVFHYIARPLAIYRIHKASETSTLFTSETMNRANAITRKQMQERL